MEAKCETQLDSFYFVKVSAFYFFICGCSLLLTKYLKILLTKRKDKERELHNCFKMQPHVQTAHLSPTHGAAKPQSPSSSTSFSNSGAAPSMSSKTHEISATTSTISSDANQQQQQPQQSADPQKPPQRKIGRWFIGETLGKGGYSWFVSYIIT